MNCYVQSSAFVEQSLSQDIKFSVRKTILKRAFLEDRSFLIIIHNLISSAAPFQLLPMFPIQRRHPFHQ